MSYTKLPRTSNRPGVIQLFPLVHPATLGGFKSFWPIDSVSALKSGMPGTSVKPSFRYVEIASSTGDLMWVPTDASL